MKMYQAAALIAVLVALVALVAVKTSRAKPEAGEPESAAISQTPATEPPAAAKAASPSIATSDTSAHKALPTMLELGSKGCKPCEYMAPIIESLAKELDGKVVVRFHDVAKRPELAERYQIMTIPTQVFLDANGKELFRHIGVFEKDEILSKMKELGMLQ